MTIAIDFDGVIHAYSRGWQDGTIYDEPVFGAVHGLRRLMKRDAVFVLTARTDLEAVAAWLKRHDLPVVIDAGTDLFWNARGTLLVTNRKLPATWYVDDRAVNFTAWDVLFRDLVEVPRADG